MRVLIVDDSRTMRRVIANCLEEMKGADLIFTDWNMPNLNGLQFLHNLMESPYKSCPVIMVTSEAEKHRIIEAVSAGARAYVVKPFAAQTLKQKIKEVLAAQPPAPPPK